FPPPAGHHGWSAEAVREVAHDFLVHQRTPKRLAWLVVHTSDDASMQRALLRIVHNYLRDVGRTTEVGRLVVRIDSVLAANPAPARRAAGCAPTARTGLQRGDGGERRDGRGSGRVRAVD